MKEIQKIQAVKTIDYEVNIPGSKSITNRVLMVSALSDGKCTLKNVLFSDDTIFMQQALRDLSFEVISSEKNSEITIQGRGTEFSNAEKPLYLGNAGTAMRFLTAMTPLGQGEHILTGNERMHERPIKDLVDGLIPLGAGISYLATPGFPPLKVISAGLKGGKTSMRGDVSSQFFSAIMLAACYAKSDTELKVIGDLVSKPYIDITLKVMADFSVECKNLDYKRIIIPSGQRYRHRDYTVEGDASNASYFFAAAAITGGRIRVNNIDFSTKQGDIQFVKILERMGCSVKSGTNYIEVQGRATKGIDVDMRDISDVAQTLAVVALFAEDRTVIRNVANMRVKETDRLRALYNELSKLGARVEEKQDGLIIEPSKTYKPAEIETYDDHRMAMAFSLSGLKIPGVIILDPACVAKTFPTYFNLFQDMCEKSVK